MKYLDGIEPVDFDHFVEKMELTSPLGVARETHAAVVREKFSDALLLSVDLLHKDIPDITFKQGGDWVLAQMTEINLGNKDEIESRIRESEGLLLSVKVCLKWPVAANTHMELIAQLRSTLAQLVSCEEDDFSAETLAQYEILAPHDVTYNDAKQALHELMRDVDMQDMPSMIAKINEIVPKLENIEKCKAFPISATVYRWAVTEMMSLIHHHVKQNTLLFDVGPERKIYRHDRENTRH